MPDLLHTSGPVSGSGAPGIGGRNYDYTRIYSPDSRGDEVKENARVWNVYLDEAENYDADMIQGFRNIIDGLLVFASLFSAVVTTFVAQTSQMLQPNNGQIIVSLLLENNELLRAAGNRTSLNAVPTTSLGPESATYTSTDVWVNGLFFTSLALSLSTALLSVLAKQWIQAYTAIVPGGAKTRALIRQFRFQGLVKWKLGDIIESLPLILHGSVAIFLVGLALYVSQLSSPICAVVAAITSLTFLFYLGTSMLPALFIACPYRIDFMFSSAQLLLFVSHMTRCSFLWLWYKFTSQPDFVIWPTLSKNSLKAAEHDEVFRNVSYDVVKFRTVSRFACDCLHWMFNHSSNHSVKEIVMQAVCGLFDEWKEFLSNNSVPFFSVMPSEHGDLFLSTVLYSLDQFSDMPLTSLAADDLDQSTWGNLIGSIMKVTSSKSLLDGPITCLKEGWQEQIQYALIKAYEVAVGRRYHVLSRCLLDWGQPKILSEEGTLFLICAEKGDEEGIRDLLDRGIDINYRDRSGWTALHCAAFSGNLEGVIALVEREPSLIHVQTSPPVCWTALDLALKRSHSGVVAYLLGQGAHKPPYTLHDTGREGYTNITKVLLDCGWDRTAKDTEGRTPVDITRVKSHSDTAAFIEGYRAEEYQNTGLVDTQPAEAAET